MLGCTKIYLCAIVVFVQFNCAKMRADLGVANTATRQASLESPVVSVMVLMFFYDE